MDVKICIDNVPYIELNGEKPVEKYTKLRHSLKDLAIYGSITESEVKKYS